MDIYDKICKIDREHQIKKKKKQFMNTFYESKKCRKKP